MVFRKVESPHHNYNVWVGWVDTGLIKVVADELVDLSRLGDEIISFLCVEALGVVLIFLWFRVTHCEGY